LKIQFYSEQIRIPYLRRKYLAKRFQKIAFFEKKSIGDINFILIDDKRIRLLNSKYLNHNYPTDTISFKYSDKNIISGDIYIGINTVIYNSYKFNCSIKRELLRVMIHGFLHVSGLNDKSSIEKLRMDKLEEFYLKLFK
jgi:probable rRNA maturation factor